MGLDTFNEQALQQFVRAENDRAPAQSLLGQAASINATGQQSVPSGVWTQILFPSRVADTSARDAMTAVANALTVLAAGIYLIAGFVWWSASAAGSHRGAGVAINGSLQGQTYLGVVNEALIPVTTIQPLSTGAVVTLEGYQDTGAGLLTGGAVLSSLSMARVG